MVENTFIKKQEEDFEKKKYIVDRKNEYSKLNQFDLQYNDLINGTDIWQETIQAIKEKFPKPE